HAGDLQRPADVEAVRVEPVLALGRARAVGEEGVRVQALAAAVVIRAAAVVGVAALGDDLDVGTAAASELRAVGVEQHLDLGDGVEVDGGGHAVAGADLVAHYAVDG